MNEETKTLLEKLEIIKTGKSNIYNALIAIGASQFLNEDTPFIDYGDVIASTHTKVIESCTVLEYLLFGAANMDSIKDNKLTYAQLGTYLEEMTRLRSKLIDNINIKGVSCTDNDSLEELIDMILDINSGDTPTPTPEPEDITDIFKLTDIWNTDSDYKNIYITNMSEKGSIIPIGNYYYEIYDSHGNHISNIIRVKEPVEPNNFYIDSFTYNEFNPFTLVYDNISELEFRIYESNAKSLQIEMTRDGEIINLYENGFLYNIYTTLTPSGTDIVFNKPVNRENIFFTPDIDDYCIAFYIPNVKYYVLYKSDFNSRLDGEVIPLDYNDLLDVE